MISRRVSNCKMYPTLISETFSEGGGSGGAGHLRVSICLFLGCGLPSPLGQGPSALLSAESRVPRIGPGTERVPQLFVIERIRELVSTFSIPSPATLTEQSLSLSLRLISPQRSSAETHQNEAGKSPI